MKKPSYTKYDTFSSLFLYYRGIGFEATAKDLGISVKKVHEFHRQFKDDPKAWLNSLVPPKPISTTR